MKYEEPQFNGSSMIEESSVLSIGTTSLMNKTRGLTPMEQVNIKLTFQAYYEEGENTKTEKQPKVKVEKQTIVCEGDDCDSKPKSPKEINGKNYCAKCYRKVEKKFNEETKVKCAHIGKKDKQCSSSASKGDYCSRHAKKNEI
jgi:hypothetical protein